MNDETLRADLLRFMFREGLSHWEVAELSEIAEYLNVAAGQVILTEGQSNSRLFFLVEGSVSVLSSGEKIATIDQPGDVLGEMSLITKKECAATLVAEIPSSLLSFDVTRINGLPERLQELFTGAMNRLFCVILARKIATTNEKARLFEITNRELQRTQKALEQASTDKISGLAHDQRQFQSRFSTVLNRELDALKQLLASDKPQGEELTRSARRLVNELKPLADALSTDSSLRDRRVLLAESDVSQAISARMSLAGTGVALTVASTLEEAQTALREHAFDVICVNESFVELIPFAETTRPGAKYVFLTSEQLSHHFAMLKARVELSTIVARHPNDRLFSVKNTATTIRKLITGDIFGTEKYLSWGTELREQQVTGSRGRSKLVDTMEEYFLSIGITGLLRRRCVTVAEELLMNAIYDAPTDGQGKPLYNHLSRTIPVELNPGEQSVFRFGCDGAFLAISVEDPFGALRRSTILSYLERCFSENIGGEKLEGKGGGGNGLFQLITSSSLTIFNVQPGVRTEVIALFNVNVQTEKVSLFPSFHFFETQS